ncbi:PspA/IM30 family protein [Candidatus Poribacteria bacterium]|jgi:phage shock protein A|nr:PspA/IM30 family protein [Candidatus Poribacteria bacterium]MBT5534789.1 PspA/IM30 family protein [Candidatus Poribacteria bacterium]MBT7098188.1 PspA/IM30 family protein [Candidatus Poribacteria bacterium]MBT7809076.1 PspA/IM30 family protein [Candidatus Poribacteria bacterium]
MAKVFKALGNWLRSKDEDAAKAIGDPVRDGKFAIEDSKKQIAEFTQKIAKLVASNKRMERERTDAEAEARKFHVFAERAAADGAEEDVRTALEQRAQAEQRLTTLDSEIENTSQLIAQLRAQLNTSRAKVAGAESNLVRMSARMEGAKVRQELAKASSSFSTGDSPLAALDNLEREVETLETEAEAWEELSTDPAADAQKSLEDKYGAAGSTEVDDEVAKLMAAAQKKPLAP